MRIKNEIVTLIKAKNDIIENDNINLLFKKLTTLSNKEQLKNVVEMEKQIIHELLLESKRVSEIFNDKLKETLLYLEKENNL